MVAFGLAHRDLSEITHIGIDEISRQKGHVYLTNVYDLKTGTLIWSGEGRSIVSLEAFFSFYGPERTKQLQGICCDMWPAFINAVRAKAPQATLVFDKFHIVRTESGVRPVKLQTHQPILSIAPVQEDTP